MILGSSARLWAFATPGMVGKRWICPENRLFRVLDGLVPINDRSLSEARRREEVRVDGMLVRRASDKAVSSKPLALPEHYGYGMVFWY